MSVAFALPGPLTVTAPSRCLSRRELVPDAASTGLAHGDYAKKQTCLPLAATSAVALALLARRRHRSVVQCSQAPGAISTTEGQWQRRKLRLSHLLGAFSGIARRRASSAVARSAAEGAEDGSDANHGYAFRMVKIAIVVTLLPFLFCLKNFFYNPALSDFNLEYGPHLAHPALRTTSTIQAIMVLLAVLWREKYRNDPIDRLFAWLFVPEAVAHIFLHFFSHHWAPANFAFAYAFSAGIALPGFLSLLCYVPKEKKLPWAYLVLYMATQIPIVSGLTDMVGPAKMRLNFANINTGWITTPFFYGILKRWKDVPKLPVLLATLTISYQITMGIMGPITGGSSLKLYDPSCIFQHGVVDIGFGFAYAASIICGVFKAGVPRPKWS
eukprot:TRINITY_DN77203_c0_g1_i1.p1 TRINITY_DN77203_c0_g1~~TRINITY_DN77203_c0_g1_i1.p1  ORF type:complete len:384 (-),score=64.18 TRINITY_DN77203_c0_g1_i1:135-1286(-)